MISSVKAREIKLKLIFFNGCQNMIVSAVTGAIDYSLIDYSLVDHFLLSSTTTVNFPWSRTDIFEKHHSVE